MESWSRWDPSKTLITHISVWGPWHAGDCLDIEKGDATPNQAGDWAANALSRGVKRPCLYCSLSDVPTVIGNLVGHGLDRTQYRLWTAHYTDVPHLCSSKCDSSMETEADATQWVSNPSITGGNYDLSLCSPKFVP